MSASPITNKNAHRKNKNCVKPGTVVTKKSMATNSAKLEVVKWAKKTVKTNKQHREKERTRMHVHTLKPSGTSKQNKQTTILKWLKQHTVFSTVVMSQKSQQH